MKTSYAVKWHEPDGRAYVGRLELGPRALHLVGDAGGARVDRQIGYDELHKAVWKRHKIREVRRGRCRVVCSS